MEELENELLEKVNVTHWAYEWVDSLSFTEFWSSVVVLTIDLITLFLVAFIADFLARRVFLTVVHRLVHRTKATWDDYFLENRVFRNLAHLIPAFIALVAMPIIFRDFDWAVNPASLVLKIYITYLVASILNRAFKALMKYSEENNAFKGKPVKTILQVFQVLNVFVAFIFVIAIIFKIHVSSLVGALAGTTAILILIFQDTINGLLANFQITMYDLLEKGDWITFESFGVDGDVISIDLTTVKVRNWDNTISSIPAKAFVSDSFVNWRGMKNTNMRRIKRNILIDINSIQYCSDDMLERFGKIALVSDYVKKKKEEIDAFNESQGVDKSASEINGRHQTNIGVYRAYIQNYLQKNPNISKKDDAMIMVRQLQPTAQGIPLEVYCFSADIVWANYEAIQSDIFDHLYAATQFFDLRLYQNVSGHDISQSFLADQKQA